MSEMNRTAAFQLTGFKQRLSESDSDDAGRVSAAGMFGKVDVASVRDSFMKKDSAATNEGSYNPVAQKLMVLSHAKFSNDSFYFAKSVGFKQIEKMVVFDMTVLQILTI